MALTILCVTFTLLLLLGVPVAFSIGLSSLATILYEGLPLAVGFQQMISGMNPFSFLAIPFFIFAGEIMMYGGIADRIVDHARSNGDNHRAVGGHAFGRQVERVGQLQGRALGQALLERAIGVVYRPQSELASHYFQAVLVDQFDAFVWFEETRAVTPLGPERPHGAPETWPFGL